MHWVVILGCLLGPGGALEITPTTKHRCFKDIENARRFMDDNPGGIVMCLDSHPGLEAVLEKAEKEAKQ